MSTPTDPTERPVSHETPGAYPGTKTAVDRVTALVARMTDASDVMVRKADLRELLGLAASAPQGDTADVIERARQIIADHCFGPHTTPAAEERALDIASACTDDMADQGLLAVAASPAAPQEADLAAVERMAHALARRRLEQSVQDLVSDEEAEAAWYRLSLADIQEFREDARAALAALKGGQA